MYTANVSVTIAPGGFKKTNGEFGPGKLPPAYPYVVATLSNLNETTPGKRPGTPSTVFSLVPKPDGTQQLKITPPKGSTSSAEVTYQLADPDYCMLGIAFAPTNEVGRDEFPTFTVTRDGQNSTMVVTDLCTHNRLNYIYGVLIQEVGTGNVGIYDPEVEVEFPNPAVGAHA